MDGGVFGLLGLIRLHRGAVEYDLRHRFRIGLRDIGTTVSLFEVARLVTILRNDPSSAIAAALEGWDYPIDRTTLAVLDLFDLTVMAHSSGKGPKPKPHGGRPFRERIQEQRRRGDAAGRTRAEMIDILRRFGHFVSE